MKSLMKDVGLKENKLSVIGTMKEYNSTRKALPAHLTENIFGRNSEDNFNFFKSDDAISNSDLPWL